MSITAENITLSDIMEKQIHKVFVRESGPGAWGGGVNVKKGSFVCRGRNGRNWFRADEDMLLWMEYEDSYMEVYVPGEAHIDVYEAYGD